jgi:hypothetical protein
VHASSIRQDPNRCFQEIELIINCITVKWLSIVWTSAKRKLQMYLMCILNWE